MFKRVDFEESDEVIEGFSYMNMDGDEERVAFDSCGIDIVDLQYYTKVPLSAVYVDDIPKLIKALQAAYKHLKENK